MSTLRVPLQSSFALGSSRADPQRCPIIATISLAPVLGCSVHIHCCVHSIARCCVTIEPGLCSTSSCFSAAYISHHSHTMPNAIHNHTINTITPLHVLIHTTAIAPPMIDNQQPQPCRHTHTHHSSAPPALHSHPIHPSIPGHDMPCLTCHGRPLLSLTPPTLSHNDYTVS